MCVLSIKVPIRKKSGNLSYAPRIIILVRSSSLQKMCCVEINFSKRTEYVNVLAFFKMLVNLSVLKFLGG